MYCAVREGSPCHGHANRPCVEDVMNVYHTVEKEVWLQYEMDLVKWQRTA
jgi:hypothetical protein